MQISDMDYWLFVDKYRICIVGLVLSFIVENQRKERYCIYQTGKSFIIKTDLLLSSISHSLYLFQLLHKLVGSLGKHLILFPYDAHAVLSAGFQGTETKLAAAGGVDDFVKSDCISQALFHH